MRQKSSTARERAIKPFVIGRKGWLFVNSVSGTHAAATIYSFVETCKWHGIEPYDWFRYVLAKLPHITSKFQTLFWAARELPIHLKNYEGVRKKIQYQDSFIS